MNKSRLQRSYEATVAEKDLENTPMLLYPQLSDSAQEHSQAAPRPPARSRHEQGNQESSQSRQKHLAEQHVKKLKQKQQPTQGRLRNLQGHLVQHEEKLETMAEYLDKIQWTSAATAEESAAAALAEKQVTRNSSRNNRNHSRPLQRTTAHQE